MALCHDFVHQLVQVSHGLIAVADGRLDDLPVHRAGDLVEQLGGEDRPRPLDPSADAHGTGDVVDDPLGLDHRHRTVVGLELLRQVHQLRHRVAQLVSRAAHALLDRRGRLHAVVRHLDLDGDEVGSVGDAGAILGHDGSLPSWFLLDPRVDM